MDAEGNIKLPEAPPQPRSSPALPYHGDIVRKLFLLGGAVMLLAIPFDRGLLPLNTSVISILVLLIALLAGVTNPRQRSIMTVNILVAAFVLLVFEYYALNGFTNGDGLLVVVIRQLLALNFFFALYFAAKTLRGALLKV